MQERKISDEQLKKHLEAAMNYAKSICVLGSSNKVKDLHKTGGWNNQLRYRYNVPGKYLKIDDHKFSEEEDEGANAFLNPIKNTFYHSISNWYYHVGNLDKINSPDLFLFCRTKENPLFDPSFQLNQAQINMIGKSMFATTMKYGNCSALASLVTEYLWRHPQGIHRIQGITTKSFDHIFLLINSSGIPEKPSTWGENAWIIDAWYKEGIVYKASEFSERIEKIKKFAEDQIEYMKKNYQMTSKDYSCGRADEILNCAWEVNPAKDRYPTYSNNLSIADYYVLKNDYHIDDTIINYNDIQDIQKKHQQKFAATLNKIHQLDTPEKRLAFFKSKKENPHPLSLKKK